MDQDLTAGALRRVLETVGDDVPVFVNTGAPGKQRAIVVGIYDETTDAPWVQVEA